jgi:hypothetical protein
MSMITTLSRVISRIRWVTHRFRYGIESLVSPTASAALQLRLRFAFLRMTTHYRL